MNSALADYIDTCRATALYESKGSQSQDAINYCLMGLLGEAGEMANKFKKILRGDRPLTNAVKDELCQELGDVLWYATRLAEECGSDLTHVMGDNAEKLLSRRARGTLRGEGDSR